MKVKGKILWLILIAAYMALPMQAEGRSYIVAQDGSGDFITIQTAANAVGPGDIVHVKPGVYRERVVISTSGMAGARITFQAYPGAIIDGSKSVLGSWSRHSGEIYRAAINYDVRAVVVDGNPLRPASSVSGMTEGSFFDTGNTTLYLWCPGGGSPEWREVGLIEWRALWPETHLVKITGDHITFSGFTLRHAQADAIRGENSHHLLVERCEIAYSHGAACRIVQSNEVEVRDSIAHENQLRNFPRGMYDDNWPGTFVFRSCNDVRFIRNVSHTNNGEGASFNGIGGGVRATDRIKIVGNILFDNWSVNGLWLDHASNLVIEKNLIYLTPNRPRPDLRPSNGCGIQFGEEKQFGEPGQGGNAVVMNNIVVGCGSAFRFWRDPEAPAGAGLKNVVVVNNTFVDSIEAAINIDDSEYHSGSMFRNNIVYQMDGDVLRFGNPGDTIFDHNCWFHPSWDGDPPGGESLWADPLFVHGTGFSPENYKIQEDSPCKDAGANAPEVPADFWGTQRPQGAAYDIGAHEYGEIAQFLYLPGVLTEH